VLFEFSIVTFTHIHIYCTFNANFVSSFVTLFFLSTHNTKLVQIYIYIYMQTFRQVFKQEQKNIASNFLDGYLKTGRISVCGSTDL
jgi:hypothetical protein